MISYLIYSTICMGLLLLFYHAFLAREKIYQINRWYLLIGLLFSLAVPFMPVGIADSLLDLESNPNLPVSQLIPTKTENTNAEAVSEISASPSGNNDKKTASNFEWIFPLILCLYSTVTLFLLVRLIRLLYRMLLRSKEHPVTYIKGYKVVLLNKEVGPHTFWKTIFVNKKQYEEGKVGEEVLIHERTHARHNHSLDILIVEILKTICWFNPILYFYKTAIQLNHEFIADDSVLSRGTDIADYQAMLLRIRKTNPNHCLSASLTFKITKKRFKMMTQHSSKYRSSLKVAAIIPFFLILGITFGCEPTSMEKDNQIKNITLELVDSNTIKLNGESLSTSEFQSRFSDLPIDPKKTIIDIKVDQNISTGIVTEVQEILRNQGALKINYSPIQSNDSQDDVVQIRNLRDRNILRVYINEEGDIIVNKKQASLSSIKKLVKEFITNDGEKASLSEGPKKANITIKTDKRTPYDIYTHVLEKIMNVYDELRNQASLKIFDKPFQSLEPDDRKQIKNMYPRQISIREPSKG